MTCINQVKKSTKYFKEGRIMTLRDDALKLHRDYKGKLNIMSKVAVNDKNSLSLAYTPGVAEPCKEIIKMKA